MKKIVLGFIFFTAFYLGFGQSAIRENQYKHNAEEIVRLQERLRNSEEDSSRVLILQDLNRQYSNVLDSGIYYGLRSLNLSRKINYHIGELYALLALETVLRHHGILLKGFNIAHKGLKAATKYHNGLFRAHFLGELGILHRESGVYPEAMKYLKQSRSLYDSIGEEYYSAYQSNNIGEVHLLRNDLDSALILCRLALKNSKEGANPYYWITFYSSLNLGNIFLAQNDFDSSLYYLRRAKDIATFHSHHFYTNLSIAKLFNKLGRRDSCLHYARGAKRVALESGVYLFNAEVNDFFDKFYRELDIDKSIKFTRESIAYKDSLYRQSIVTALENFDELDEQERQFEIQAAQAAYQFQARLAGLLTGVIVLLIITGILVRNYQQKLKSNLRLAQVQQEKEHFELEKTKEIDKAKSTFFANISHEFRTPLTLIKGPAQETMEEFSDHPKVKERMKLVQRNADVVLGLINQLLDLAKLGSGNLTVERTQNDLNSLLNDVTNSFSSFAIQKNIALAVQLPSARFLMAFDKGKLETVLVNLINNAIKFTPSGGSVKVIASVAGQNNSTTATLIITISDTGIGIPVDQFDKVFERFHQVSDAHEEIGTGIGLSLGKELIELMGGTLTLNSELGKGSDFTISLPMEIIRTLTEFEPVGVHNEVVEGEDGLLNGIDMGSTEDNASSILVVEDNEDLRKFIIQSLGNEFQYFEASNGVEGLSTAFDEMPDLIISDVMMPWMDGITMTGKLKKDTRTSHIPLILLTAKTTDESKLAGLSTGADDYLTKPFNKKELLLKVRNSIASRIKLREKIRLELLKKSPKMTVQSADEQFLYKVREEILSRLSDEQLGVESLAEEIGLSRSQLLRKITALTGMSVNELIRTFRLQKAAQLLEQNWGPVTQVAYEVGISNLSYFSKAFKEKYGVLPSEYRKKAI